MMRTLPAAGHSIRLGTVLGAFCGPGPAGLPLSWEAAYPGACLTSSGTAAICAALSALRGRSAARQVLLPAYTCPSVPAAVIRSGLEPVLCDLEPGCFRMDRNELEARIGDDTLAVVAVHLFGIPEDVAAIRERIGARPVAVIEDATQAVGNRDGRGGAPLGRLGDLGVLSFGRGKPLSVLAGGAVVAGNPELAAAVRGVWERLPAPGAVSSSLRHLATLAAYSILFHPRLFWIPRRLPWLRLGETYFTLDFPVTKAGPGVARMLGRLWPRFSRIREERASRAAEYASALEACPGVQLPPGPGQQACLLRYPLIFDSAARRDRALEDLTRRGLGGSGMYPAPLHRIPGLRDHFPDAHCPNAESIAKRILTLPLHDRVTSRDVERIGAIVREACRGPGGPPAGEGSDGCLPG